MITRAQKIRLGVFVTLALVVAVAFLAAVVGSFLWETRDEYEVAYDISVSGLEIGAPVKYNGVRVGRVEKIRIDPREVSRTLVSISTIEGTPVKENTRAVLNVQGITGLKFIELVGGTSESPNIPVGSEIAAGASTMDKLTGQAESISVKAEILINQLMALTGEENRGLVTEVLERGGNFLKNLDETLTKNAENLDRLFKALSTSAEGLSATFDEGRRAIAEARETLIAIRRAAEVVQEDAKRLGTLLDEGKLAVEEVTKRVGPGELGKITASFAQLVVRTDALIEKLDLVVTRSREDVLASMRFLTETIENMRDFSRLIREDPSRLLKGQERRERVLP